MRKLEQRLAALEKQTKAAAIFQVIIYDLSTGPPARTPAWPRVTVLIPDNHRDAKKSIMQY